MYLRLTLSECSIYYFVDKFNDASSIFLSICICYIINLEYSFLIVVILIAPATHNMIIDFL